MAFWAALVTWRRDENWQSKVTVFITTGEFRMSSALQGQAKGPIQLYQRPVQSDVDCWLASCCCSHLTGLGNSIALLSDSFNMLSDLISLCVGLGSGYIARRGPRGSSATYGYVRAEVVGALSNAVFLTALCFTIFVEAVLRLARPERIDDPELVLIVGALGLAVNVVGLLIFQDCGACFSRCTRGHRTRPSQPPRQGDTGGALGCPREAATATDPGSDSAVTLRGASAGRKQQEGATVFSNVAELIHNTRFLL